MAVVGAESSNNVTAISVLLVDDEAEEWRPLLELPLDDAGIELVVETEPGNVLARIAEIRPDILMLDVLFPGLGGQQVPTGSDLLPQIVESYPDIPVVMFTTTMADDVYELTVSDFPGAAFVFSKSIFHEERTENRDPYLELAHCLKRVLAEAHKFHNIEEQLRFVVGQTKIMRELVDNLVRVSATDLPVLICGESGTGKELLAESLHRLSKRREKPFVKVNCGALTDETLESTLFGHKRGAFTGATAGRVGLFEEADAGTLFLDEVQSMSPRLQQSLLRALQDSAIRPMGSETDLNVDVRIIAATNEDLEARRKDETFRGDLYFRLNRSRLDVPPLRDRRADLVELFEYFVGSANKKMETSVSENLRKDLRNLMELYDWPGNVRELQSAVEAAVALSKSNLLTPADFHCFDDIVPESHGSGAAEHLSLGQESSEISLLTWTKLRDIKGAQRRSLLLEFILDKQKQMGRRPTSAEIAELLDTTSGNVRRILHDAKIKLRDLGGT